MDTNRINYMDWIKGFAMLLVIIGHALLGMYQSEAFLANQSVLERSTNVIYSFHMPLFFMVSGYFYGYKNLGKGECIPFLEKKVACLWNSLCGIWLYTGFFTTFGRRICKKQSEYKKLFNDICSAYRAFVVFVGNFFMLFDLCVARQGN